MLKSLTEMLIDAYAIPYTFDREQSADDVPRGPAQGTKAYERGEDVEAQLYRKTLNP